MSVKVNPWVSTLNAYTPGEQPAESGWIKLNTNESPYPPAPHVVEATRSCCSEALFNKYPDPVAKGLRTAIGNSLGFPIEQILAGNGSDEILRLICHAFLTPGDTIGMTDPTYTLYEVLAAMFGAGSRMFATEPPDYSLPSEIIDSDVRILFLPNPNPPVGTYYTIEQLSEVAAANTERLLVIDEAYTDFGPGSAVELVRTHANIIVTRTFSKSYSLAGMRVGFMVAPGALIAEAEKIKDSYNLNRVSLVAAEAAWNSTEYYAEKCRTIRSDRAFLRDELLRRGFAVPESEGNFLFARRPDAKSLYENLKARKILVRYFNTPRLADGLRITIGTRAELEALLSALDKNPQPGG